jgi:hypothetical protein
MKIKDIIMNIVAGLVCFIFFGGIIYECVFSESEPQPMPGYEEVLYVAPSVIREVSLFEYDELYYLKIDKGALKPVFKKFQDRDSALKYWRRIEKDNFCKCY